MTQRGLLNPAAGEPCDADTFDKGGAIGDVLTKVAPSQPGYPPQYKWRPIPPPPPPPAPFVDLTNANYVDQLTVVPVPQQTGNIEEPFATFAAVSVKIAAAVVPQAIIATDYDYTAEPPLVLPGVDVSIVCAGSQSKDAPTNLLLPTNINTPGSITIQGAGCTNVTADGDVNVYNVSSGGVLTAGGNVSATNCPRISDVNATTADFTNCSIQGTPTLSGVTCTCTNVSFPIFTNIVFSGAAGTVFMDGVSYESWLASGSVLMNGTISFDEAIPQLLVDLNGQGHAISNFHNGASAADLPLPANGLTAFPDVLISGLAANSTFCATYGFRVGWYVDGSANHSVNGEADCQLGASIRTDGAGVATVTFNTLANPNLGYLPAGLLGATFDVIATVAPGGFTIRTQRPPGVACHSWYEFWLQRYRKVA